jgi:Xaa-Pro aminopeptidase
MQTSYSKRAQEFQRRISDEKIDLAFIYDPDNIYYLSAYWGYLGMEFGRPTLMIVPRFGSCSLITPGLESEMARKMTWIEDIREWTDGVGGEWGKHLDDLCSGSKKLTVGIERYKIHPLIGEHVRGRFAETQIKDISPILAHMRMVKSPAEIELMHQAGQVAVAMCDAAVNVIGEGIPEYEVALEMIAAGSRKAAEFIHNADTESLYSPMLHNLQIMQSGRDLSMVHHRPSVRRIQKGDPVYLCFCPFTMYKQLKLGFDREYFVKSATDEHARIYEIALKAQVAALETIRPGVLAEEVHAASLEIYQSAGFGICYRTGRGIGYSHLESPEFKAGDRTPLQVGMTFAVDGGITVPGEFGARVGDSVVVTENGFDYLTPYPKQLRIL